MHIAVVTCPKFGFWLRANMTQWFSQINMFSVPNIQYFPEDRKIDSSINASFEDGITNIYQLHATHQYLVITIIVGDPQGISP